MWAVVARVLAASSPPAGRGGSGGNLWRIPTTEGRSVADGFDTATNASAGANVLHQHKIRKDSGDGALTGR